MPDEQRQPEHIAARYIRENFQADDRIAVVLIHRQTNQLMQRSPVAVEVVASQAYQKWLSYENGTGSDVYVSMNSVKADATGRKKGDIAAIRHVYLDFDFGGRAIVDKVLAHPELPKPNYVLESSPNKFQVIWKAQNFELSKAEELLRGLARETGADPAVTDAARVLRLPGFRNWKYDVPFFVTLERYAQGIVRDPRDFPERLYELGRESAPRPVAAKAQDRTYVSQSERDFGYAIRKLQAGIDAEVVRAAIEQYRTARGDKAQPGRYAERTVAKAQEIVRREKGESRDR